MHLNDLLCTPDSLHVRAFSAAGTTAAPQQLTQCNSA